MGVSIVPLLGCALLGGWGLAGTAGDEPRPAIGERIAPFSFMDTRYLTRSLSELGERRAYVIVFTSAGCPLANRYLPRLAAMEREYRDRAVQFLALNVSSGDSVVEAAEQGVLSGAEFPFGKDWDGAAVRAVGVRRTPEVVVLDHELRLRYRGRIDDQYRLGGVRPAASRADLREALDDLLEGREPRVAETEADGCLITAPGAVRPAADEPPVTYSGEVAPILERHCLECHRPGGQAPFSLAGYEQAAAFSAMIDEVVKSGRMPPWFAGRRFDEFVNRRGLNDREKTALAAWVSAGSPAGDLEVLAPAPPQPPPREWLIETPDLVLEAPAVELPADGYVPYKYAVLPYVFQEDTWVEDLQILPDNPLVLHHANLVYYDLGEEFKLDNFITGQVPGGYPMDLAPGMAVLIPSGSVLGLEIHYVTTGRAERDRLRVGLRFPRAMVQKRVQNLQVYNRRFAIPAGAPAHEVRAQRRLAGAATGLGLFAHMHLRGRDMIFLAHYPDGRTENLLTVPNYSFDWQLAYRWADGAKKLPAGTTIECIAHFDNSAFNPYNPDPGATVRFGPQTYHEMMYGFLFYTEDGENLEVWVDPDTGVEL